jgi:hypothetical protein
LLVICSPPSLAAPKCMFSSIASPNFGIYDVFVASPNTAGVGNVTIHCQGGNGLFSVTLRVPARVITMPCA